MTQIADFIIKIVIGGLFLDINFSLIPRTPRAKREIAFEEVTPDLKIIVESGYVIETFATKKHLKCATKCLQNPECKSFTYCKDFCLLNSIGFAELLRNEFYANYISNADNCDIFGMKNRFVPECVQLGKARSIREDSNPNYCQLNRKRVDGTFLERHYFNASVENSVEFRGFMTRKCVTETALNGGYCKEENETKAVWVKWWHYRTGFTESVDYCDQLGGILYPDLDGDEKQLDFLRRFGAGLRPSYWLGVVPDAKWYLWRNLRGEKMTPDRMRWTSLVDQGTNRAAQIDRRFPFIRNAELQLLARTVCQMIK